VSHSLWCLEEPGAQTSHHRTVLCDGRLIPANAKEQSTVTGRGTPKPHQSRLSPCQGCSRGHWERPPTEWVLPAGPRGSRRRRPAPCSLSALVSTADARVSVCLHVCLSAVPQAPPWQPGLTQQWLFSGVTPSRRFFHSCRHRAGSVRKLQPSWAHTHGCSHTLRSSLLPISIPASTVLQGFTTWGQHQLREIQTTSWFLAQTCSGRARNGTT